ncbi:hypothetical protein AMELA_G00154140 [Ameiurus melas]|uniref:Uncharacterized protein n=1 Tax=Ameiurus melas TaxID=219545 RepID=A0A7J6AIB5_AMEME|nr:hypothetical protein AMELA_G00154140 [Ameiurus melas]
MIQQPCGRMDDFGVVFESICAMRVTGNLEPIPGSIRHKVRYTLDRVPVHRNNMQTPHAQPRQESNPGSWRCEANVLTTKPPCAPSMKCILVLC